MQKKYQKRLEDLKLNFELLKATVTFLIKDYKVLLGERIKSESKLGESLFSGIGGKLESGETFDEANLRELKEEINVELVDYKQVGWNRFVVPHKPNWSMEVAVYIATSWKGEPQATDVMRPVWFEKDKLPKDRMWQDNLIWLPKLFAGEEFEGFFLFDDKGEIIEHFFE